MEYLYDNNELINWFENIFIGQKQYDQYKAKIQEFVAADVVEFWQDGRTKANLSVKGVKYVNDVLGTKWYK